MCENSIIYVMTIHRERNGKKENNKEKCQIMQHKRDPWVRGMSTLTRDGTTASGAKGQGNINFPVSSNDEQDWQPHRLICPPFYYFYM